MVPYDTSVQTRTRPKLFAAHHESSPAVAQEKPIDSHRFSGGLAPILEAFRHLLARGGRILVGEGYWKREPDPGYLSLLGGTREHLFHT